MKIWKMCFRWLATCAALTVMVQSVSAAKGRLGVDLIFVDGSVQGYGIIAQSALPGYRVVVLNPERDEMTQISDEFSRMTQNGEQANSVHIVSHGSPGTIRLGAQSISTSTLKGRAAELAAWRAGLSPSASIYLYGCETGAGESGMAYLQEWASLTGANVAASANRTGASRLGADWTLEVSTGAVESKAAFDLQTLQKLPEVLIDYIFYHDGTAGKLYRSELDGANQTAILTYNGSFSTVAVDFVVADPVNSNLYYNRIFNDVNRGLYKTTFAGASPVRISPNTTNLVSGMSLDLVNNKVYIHDDTAGKWYRMNLDGSGAQVLQTTAGTATFSAVDTKHSVFYYTQTIVGSTRGLYKTDLAMTTAGTQITTAGNQITGVAVDMTHDKIYYHDNTGTAIFQANLDGSSPVNKLTTSANTPVIGITVDHVNQRIYYAGTAGSSFQSLRGVYRTADLDLTTPTRVSTANDLVGPAGVTTIYVAPPSISGVTGPSAGSYNAGDNLDFTVTYDTAVDVTGSPYLPLTVGSSSVNATYSSGTGTTTLVFRYTVQAGDTDSNGIASSSPLVLNGGTIVKASGSTAANLTFTTPTTTSVLVDTTAPTISIGSPSASITAGGPVSYTVTYADANFQSSTLSAGNITVNTTGSASASSVVVSGSGTTRTVTLSGITGSGTLGISIASGTGSDVAGNLAPGAGPSTTFTVDNTAPTVSIGSPSASLTAGGPVSYTVTYSDANFQSSTLSAGNITVNSTGSASASSVVVSGSGTTRTVTLSGITGNGTLGISIASGTATDLAGNTSGGAGPSTTFTVDNTAPTVSIGSPSASITAGGPISYTVTYSDANFQSSTLSAGNITVNSTGSASASSVVVSGSGTTRSVTLSGITGNGTLGISIASGTATDLAGNTAGAAGPSTTFTVDNTAPTVSIGSPSASLTAGGPISYTVTYSDANFQSSTLSAGNITVNSTGSASASSVVVSGSGTTRTVTLSGITGDGTLGISIASGTATDLAGNTAGAAGPSTTFTVDNTAPTAGIGSPSASVTATGPVNYTVTYSDANFQSSTLSSGDVTVNSSGTASASSVVVSGSGTTRTVTLSGITGDGTLGISIGAGTAADTAGNTAPAAGPSSTFTVDNTAPTVGISAPSASTTASGPITYTVTYTDANFNASTLANGDITLNKTGSADATVNVTGTGNTRTVTLSAITGDGTLGISVAAGTATDTAGNTAAAAGPSATFDVHNGPTVTTTAATDTTVTGATLHATINPNGISTTAAFEYGTDTNYGSVVGITLSPDDSTTNQDVSAIVSGLFPGVVYHFRAAGTNSSGSAYGEDLTFTTASNSGPPTAILLSSSTVNENEPSGTTVGTLSATDPDTGDTHTFALVSGAGSTDNGSFAISGNALQTAASFDFETKNSYSVRIQATDAGGATFEQSFTINVANVNEAPIYNGYTLTAAKDTATTFLVAKVIVKTSDPEGNTRTISGVSSTSSQGGTAQLIGSSIKYTPAAGFVGSDSFSVTITDGSLSTTGFITVNVGGSTGSGPALVSVTVVGSDVQLKFSGIPGNHYDIQRSTTLVAPADWSTISTVTANSSGFVLYTDSSPPSPSYWRTLNNP